ncbi:MAG: YXWGXW repeat-containing protein [Myxococcota bacterium]
MRLRRGRFFLGVVIGATASVSCGPAMPYVGPNRDVLARDYREVDHPPPPARAETIPARPSATAQWIDGAWAWDRGRWSWVVGRWVEPPANAIYQAWDTCWCSDGNLLYRPGAWRGSDGAVRPPPEPLALASTSRGPVVDEEGATVEVGANVASKRRYFQRAQRRHRRETRRKARASQADLTRRGACLEESGRSLRPDVPP